VGHSVCKLAGLQAQNDYQNPNRVVLHGKTACVDLHPQVLNRRVGPNRIWDFHIPFICRI